MEKITSALYALQEINTAYGLSNEAVEKGLSELGEAKVCIPIIGKFSTGKSALVNTALGYSRKILKEDITPETAVPTEIVYSDMEDGVTLFQKDGLQKNVGIAEYRSMELDANTVKCARLGLRNSFLEKIPDVMVVDMPGFESGFEIHNKAIDDYLPQSLAYIIAFPADDLIVRSSVGNILKELCLHDMPLCVAVTKYDKRGEDFEETFGKMKESLKRFVGEREITFCRTSSFTGDADELKEFLMEMQRQSKKILSNRFQKTALSCMDMTESYLRTMLKNSEMSESELEEEEERLGKRMDRLGASLSREKEDFGLQVSQCVEEIKSDVQAALDAEEPTLVTMAMNGQSIKEQVNSIVRNAVTVSVKKRLAPKVEKYLKRVSDCFSGEAIGEINVMSFHIDLEGINKGIVGSVVAVTAGLIMGLPVLGLVVAGVVALVSKIVGDGKREKARNEIRSQLRSQVYPQIMMEVEHGMKTAVTKQVELINASIEEEIQSQRNTLEKAMSDLKGRIHDEKARKENLEADIKNDLERLGEIRNGL